MQPEASALPACDIFNDQYLPIQILSKLLPADTYIYVKEHLAQPAITRTYSFFRDLSDLKNVRIISKTTSTFDLIQNSVAVITGTGTAGIEALFYNKPVIYFGSTVFEAFPGAFRVRTTRDFELAVRSILNGDTLSVDLQQIRLFYKALEDCSCPGFVGALNNTSIDHCLDNKATLQFIPHKLLKYLQQSSV